MKKRLLVLFAVLTLAVCAMFMCISASAATVVDSGTCGVNVTWTLYDDGLLKISGTGDMEDYTASKFAPWYDCEDNITEVVIEEGVTNIGNYAFDNCYNLISIEIPDGVTSIGNYAFPFCFSLTSIEIPDSVTNIGDSAFSGCDRLTSIEIPNGVTSIGSGVFFFCSSLTSIEIPDSVTSIGGSAFYGCNSLTAIEVDEDNINYCDIDGVLFSKDKKVLIQYPIGKTTTEYIIPDGVTSIGGSAFFFCSSLTSIEIPDSVASIGNGAFDLCSSLTSIEIPNSVTSIDSYAFYGCSSLETITIYNKEGAVTIGEDAFPSTTTIIYNSAATYMSGFSVRYEDYAGLRGVFTIDLTLDKGDYKLTEYGAVMAASAAMDREEITVDNNASKVTIWSDGKWIGKVLSYEEGVYTQFACTITYKDSQVAKYGTNDLYMRGYEIWKNAKTGETMVLYTDYKTDADYKGTDLYQTSVVSYLANPGKDTSDFLWNRL